ncbi:MAG: tetratricopeptide repeat protein [Planctomycetota bacterium]
MTSRWFIPFSLLVFAVLVGGLWTYLSATEEPTPARWVRSSRGLLMDVEPVEHSPTIPVTDPSVVTKHKKKPTRHFVEPPTMQWSDVAAHLDEASVKLRLDATDSTTGELLGAQRDLDAGRHHAALRAYDSVLVKSKSNTVALAGRAAALTALERLDDVEASYEFLIRIAPRDAAARYNFGVLLYRRGKHGEASTQFRELVTMQPDHARGHYNLATLAQRAGRLAEARDEWLAFTRLEPSVPSGWFNLGVVQMDFEEPLDAARCFAVYTVIRPDEADGFTNLGAAHAAAGDVIEAMEAMTAADGMAPCDPMVMTALVDLHEAFIDMDVEHAQMHRAQALCINEQLSGME